MGKKFVNLPSNYRSFLDSIKDILDHNLIKNIANNDIGFEDINKLHYKIEEIANRRRGYREASAKVIRLKGREL